MAPGEPSLDPATNPEIGKLIADSSAVLLWVSNAEKECVYFNKSWLDYRGRTLAQEFGYGWAEGVHPEDYQRCLDIYVSHFDKRLPFSMDYRLKKGDDSYGWIRDDGTPYFNDAGEFLGYVGSCYDITEQKSIEEQLRHNEKMDAIGQLAGGIAHDFNNQLASILGYAELLLEISTDKSNFKYLNNIITSAKHSRDLTKQLLTFSRKQSLNIKELDLQQEVLKNLDLLERTIDKRIQINVNFAADNHCLEGDESSIQNALLNLSLNACYAMPEGGKLCFSTENVTAESDRFLHKIAPDKQQYVCLTVSDSGVGIKKEHLSEIFNPFFTTKPMGKGTGMGLASVYGTVKQHHGYIFVESDEGSGSYFYLYFPVSKKKSSEMGECPEGPSSTPECLIKAKTLLVVDDEKAIRELCNDVLGGHGYNVITAIDGDQAIALYATQMDSIDLIILDLAMPKMNGIDTLRKLKDINPCIQVVISSGYQGVSIPDDLLEDNIRGKLIKPFHLKELLSSIEQALN